MNRRIALLIAALIIAGLGTGLVYAYVKSADDRAIQAQAPVSVLVAKVPIDRIEELHLFAPLRSGGVETGIAVVAARVPVIVPAPVAQPEEQFEHALDAETGSVVDVVEAIEVVEQSVVDDVASEHVVSESDEDASEPDPYAPEELHAIVEEAIEASIEYRAEESPAVAVERHTVYTARYRLVQKGLNRGKWEADVVDEADAPLITVEMVVRGVQRRAGEASETTRYSGSQIARALRIG